jgi:hypothetical protein
MLRTPTTWLRVSRRPSREFVFEIGARGEREPYRAFLYPPQELPTVLDAMTLAKALVDAPPMLAVLSVPTAFVAGAALHLPPPVLARVEAYPIARLSYQVPVTDREALRALLKACERRIGAHVDAFEEAEAVNLAGRVHRALGAV